MNRKGELEMDCGSVRIARDERNLGPAARLHIDQCAICADEQRIEGALRSTLVVETSPELSARLLALAVPTPRPSRLDAALESALVLQAPADLSRQLACLAQPGSAVSAPRRPWVMPVYAATVLLLGILLVLAGQAYGQALQALGVGDWWRAAAELPSTWLNQVIAMFPQSRYIVDTFFALQRALQWVLVGLLMWAVLEMGARQRGSVTAQA